MSAFNCQCGAKIGNEASQGGLRIRGLAIILVKSDGTVHGPCQKCRADVVISQGGTLSKSVQAAMGTEVRPRRRRDRVVFVVEDTS